MIFQRLRLKGESYRFSVWQDPSVKTERHTER